MITTAVWVVPLVCLPSGLTEAPSPDRFPSRTSQVGDPASENSGGWGQRTELQRGSGLREDDVPEPWPLGSV